MMDRVFFYVGETTKFLVIVMAMVFVASLQLDTHGLPQLPHPHINPVAWRDTSAVFDRLSSKIHNLGNVHPSCSLHSASLKDSTAKG